MRLDYDMKWRPSRTAFLETALHRCLSAMGEFEDYQDMHAWSVTHKEEFWTKIWDFCGVIGDKGDTVFQTGDKFQDARFFPDGKLNFAENLLRRRDDGLAIVFRGEDKVEINLTFKELYDQVSCMRQALQGMGVTSGDCVAGYLPNMPETIIAMLAATSLGAVWSSASPDFGVQGVLDRFGQIEPKILFAVDGYYYNGKETNCREKLGQIVKKLPSLTKSIVIPYIKKDMAGKNISFWADIINKYSPQQIVFERFPFNHPLYIMFSSGTTGVPKCIIHGAGGTLLQHLKEHQLQCDIRKDDRVFYFTTCGWMMWNWLVSALASEACLLLYDGSPLYPDGYTLFKYAENYNCTLFGVSAKFIDALQMQGIHVKEEYDLRSVRLVTSTGSPLSPEAFDYVYEHLFPDAQLASISGGTDIVSCFLLGNPASPVYRGEIQGAGLGMDVDIFDDNGKSMMRGKGELVCKSPFPSMPIGFWNDPGGVKYQNAYFGRFPNIWCHGDWCERTQNEGIIIHGRSDATLNPGGVRIGTAEIYRIVEQLPQVLESIVVGQDWEGDVRVVLFVALRKDVALDEELKNIIKKAVRAGATPRHVPACIVAVTDIPRTKSGKITELAVRDVIHGRAVKNIEALANPEALTLYENLKELKV